MSKKPSRRIAAALRDALRRGDYSLSLATQPTERFIISAGHALVYERPTANRLDCGVMRSWL
ncbi:MAG: hypothetical protein M3Q39_13735 [Actinomycetota bacterium]|nr:hypothetical protein [Actinomycetota bacterium]